MSQRVTCTLSEALTDMAVGDPTMAQQIPAALKDCRWGCSRAVAVFRFRAALNTLNDAAYRGDILLWGKPDIIATASQTPHSRRLTQGECQDYRRFVPGYDSLWMGKNRGSEFVVAFEAHSCTDEIADIRIDRANFKQLMATVRGSGNVPITAQSGPTPFTATEIDNWIRSSIFTGMKKARNVFMQDPRAKGFSATFESRWNAIKKNKVGRPRNQ